MSNHDQSRVSRRSFVQQTGLLAGGAILGASPPLADAAQRAPANGELPRRVLGKTKIPITALTLGTAPAGFSRHVSPRQIADLVNTALDEGINSIDTASAYGEAEEGVGLGLGRRRKDAVLGTKVMVDTVEEAEKSLSQSMKLLKTDYFDVLYFHNLGNRKLDGATGPDGVFTWLLKQKKAGKARFVGISGHNRCERFLPFIKSGELDVALMNLSFVDRYIYGFQKDVLPAAAKAGVGILAIKVFAGPRGGFAAYGGPKVPPQIGERYMELAIRYCLGLPGVASVNIGVHDPQQIRKNVEMVKNYRPLSPEEHELLAKVGRQMAPKLGPRFGPVGEEEAAAG